LPGDTFGVETMAKHNFSAEAVTDVNILAINSDASNASQLLLMGRELKRAQNQVLLLAMNAPQRVATFLLEMAERIRSRDPMELPMSRQDIADYLGLTIETVSRTLTQLENEAAIALPTSKGVVLRNRAILKRLSA
jgi:CRP/FNR family transcriptional regulator, nitrogen fixation regulation protein